MWVATDLLLITTNFIIFFRRKRVSGWSWMRSQALTIWAIWLNHPQSHRIANCTVTCIIWCMCSSPTPMIRTTDIWNPSGWWATRRPPWEIPSSTSGMRMWTTCSRSTKRDSHRTQLNRYAFRLNNRVTLNCPQHGLSPPQLNYDGISIDGIQVQPENSTVNTFQTFWQQSDVNLTRGLDFVPRGNVFAR